MRVWKISWLRTLKNNSGSNLFKKCYKTKYNTGFPILIPNWIQFCLSDEISSGTILLFELHVAAAELH